MNINLLLEYYIKEILLEKKSKKRKKKKLPGRSVYYKGTKKSNAQMAYEINKCSKKPTPKSCYDYWDADKTYDRSKKGKNKK